METHKATVPNCTLFDLEAERMTQTKDNNKSIYDFRTTGNNEFIF